MYVLKRISFSSFFISILYFLIYFFVPVLKNAVYSGGFWAVLHALMGVILIVGVFGIVLFTLHYLFSDPTKK